MGPGFRRDDGIYYFTSPSSQTSFHSSSLTGCTESLELLTSTIFAKRLSADYEAVRAAVTLSWSNGPVEGQINRLKMLKRTMYGRAGLTLLSRRFLLAA